MQRRSELDALADDLALFEGYHRRDNLNLRLWPGSHPNQLLEDLVVLRSAIRISGAVFRNRADVDRARASRFRPAHRHRKKMRITKWHVCHGDRTAVRSWRAQFIFRHGN